MTGGFNSSKWQGTGVQVLLFKNSISANKMILIEIKYSQLSIIRGNVAAGEQGHG
jgi:hypothetical protein